MKSKNKLRKKKLCVFINREELGAHFLAKGTPASAITAYQTLEKHLRQKPQRPDLN